ncbi:MAG: hypothetical protein QOI95_319 [Acidimicrobiaceae bacterium]
MFNAALAREVLAVLQRAGVDGLLLKGPTTSQLLAEPGRTRSYGDVDVLVRLDDLVAAQEVLRHAGFHSMWEGAALDELSGHAVDLVRGRAQVDLHWRIAGIRLPPEPAWQVLWAHRIERSIPGGGTAVSLDDRAALLLIGLHAAADPHQHPKVMDDLTRAVRLHGIDRWREAARLAQQLEASDFLASGLLLVAGGDSVVDALDLRRFVSTESVLRSHNPPPLALGIERLVHTQGAWPKVKILARELVPTPSGLRYWRPNTGRSKWALALAYLQRPVFLLRSLRPALAAIRRARRTAAASRGCTSSSPS